MNKVLLVQNLTREKPGMLLDVLKNFSLPFDIVDLDKGEAFPNPSGYGAIFVFGGTDSANNDSEKMTQEIASVKKAVEAGIPFFGVCLGMQVLVKAMGGEVFPNEVKEVGFRDKDGFFFKVEITALGQRDKLCSGLPVEIPVMQLHSDTVSLTPSMQLLGTGNTCINQIVKVGENAYGTQGHFEVTEEMFEAWITSDPDLLQLNGPELRSDFESVRIEYETTGRQLFTNFLKIAKLV